MDKRIILASASPRRRELLEQIGVEFEVITSDCDENIDVNEAAELVKKLSFLKSEDVLNKLVENNSKDISDKLMLENSKDTKDKFIEGSLKNTYDILMDKEIKLSSDREKVCNIIVIGSDTIVAIDGKILGKPANEEEAYEMIKSLQNNVHQVYTGVSVYQYIYFDKDNQKQIDSINEYINDITNRKDTDIIESNAKYVKVCSNFSVKTDVYVNKMSEKEIKEYISTKEPYDKAGGYGIQGTFGKFIEKISGDYYNVVGLPISEVYKALKRSYS